MPLVDLSHPISSGMPVYPGDPEVRIALALSVPHDGVEVHELHLGSHTGTHLDAPAHSIVGGRTVEQLSLEQLCGDAVVLQVADPLPGSAITMRTIQTTVPTKLPEIVFIATGWDTHFRTATALQHPYIHADFARELWSRGARVLGVDFFSPDPSGTDITSLPVHDFWLGHDGIIVENLANISMLPAQCSVSLFPLPLTGVDGSPVRAIAQL